MNELEENNKLIAEYMGAKWWPKSNNIFVKYSEAYEFNNSVAFSIKGLNYHLSWDWLMPVILKIISEHQTDFFIDRMNYDNFFIGLGTNGTYAQNERNESAIEASYKAVIGFIKYFNKHTNESKN